jgi:hypothetical protein
VLPPSILVCSSSGAGGKGGKVRSRRLSPPAVRPGEGRLSEPTAGAQPSRREPLFVPRSVPLTPQEYCWNT